MSHPCYCYPCSPCCTPCYPPCCTLCYVPYIVCCNPSCPAKPCRPASPPKKTRKLTDFSIAGPSDGSKNNEIKKRGKDKDSKNVKDKEEKKSQSPKKSSTPKVVKNTGGGGGIKKDVGTKEKEGGGETDFAYQATVVKSHAGEKGKPVTTGAMGDIVKDKVAKTEEVTETREKEHPGTKEGAGDSASPRKVICKCFAKQCRCTPKPTVCTPKPVVRTPQPMYKPNPVFGYTSQPGYKCTCKPFCQCVCKSKGATVFPSSQNSGRQLGAPHIYSGTGCTMFPYAGTPNLQSPRTAPSTRHKSRQPGTAPVSRTGGYTFPFPGEIGGLFKGKVAPKRVPSPQGSTMPTYLGNKPAVAQVCSGKGYNKLPFAGDGLSPGNTYNRQPNVSVLPSQNKRWQPQTSQTYQGVTCVKPPVEYIRSICGTCGTIKYKPKDPVDPQKCKDCYFKGSFAFH